MKKILSLLVVTATILATAACSRSKDSSDSNIDFMDQNTELAQALAAGDIDKASAVADSMSLFVDDFTPEQTVQVLMAFLTVHNDAVAKKQTRRDLETLRKYVDVYDIALSVNPNDTRAIFEKAHRANPAVNFDSIAKDFRARLTNYDAVQGGELTTSAPADTAAATKDSTTSSQDLPLELRPAE